MPPSRTSSSSSTDVPGFRLERVIGRGSASVVYEATQLSLQRRVALKLLAVGPGRGGELRWPEHRQVVSLYAAGPCPQGYFVAMQLVRGGSLARRLETRRPGTPALLRMLGDVAAALDAAHRAGIAHGAVAARNVLVDDDGRAFLSDFGLGALDATPEADLADFAALVRECVGAEVPDPLPSTAEAIVRSARDTVRVRPGGRRAVPALAVLAGIAIVAGLVASSSDDGEQVPGPLANSVVLGSSLSESGIRSVDCSGSAPSGASEPCVVAQTRLDDRPVAARSAGVVRRWAVRGARGELALEVLRRRGSSTYLVARTPYSLIRDEGTHLLSANLPVRAGDLVGLAVAPGAGVGVRRVDGAITRRRVGPTDIAPGGFDGEGIEEELLLRVEYLPGATWRPAGRVTGRAAAQAAEGRRLDVLELQRDLTVAAVSVQGRVAADLLSGERRVARLFIPGARPDGRLASLSTQRLRFGQPIVRLAWRNPHGLVSRDFSVSRRALVPLD